MNTQQITFYCIVCYLPKQNRGCICGNHHFIEMNQKTHHIKRTQFLNSHVANWRQLLKY